MKCEVKNDDIVSYVKEHYGYTPKSCAIAQVKREMGYDVVSRSQNPKYKLTERDRKAIKEAIIYHRGY